MAPRGIGSCGHRHAHFEARAPGAALEIRLVCEDSVLEPRLDAVPAHEALVGVGTRTISSVQYLRKHFEEAQDTARQLGSVRHQSQQP